MDSALAMGLANSLGFVFQLLIFVILISVMISWLDANPSNPIVKTVTAITEPMYNLVRPLTNKIPLPLDLAPMVVVFIIIFLQSTIIQWLKQYAQGG